VTIPTWWSVASSSPVLLEDATSTGVLCRRDGERPPL
jgi:hypothetical protein